MATAGQQRCALRQYGAAAAMLGVVCAMVACTTLPPRPAADGAATHNHDAVANDMAKRDLDSADGDADVADVGPRPTADWEASSGSAMPADVTVSRLQGLAAIELTMLLGQPRLLRREPPTEVWQYQADHCVLDVFLLGPSIEPASAAPATINPAIVSYVESRDRRGHLTATQPCLDAVAQPR